MEPLIQMQNGVMFPRVTQNVEVQHTMEAGTHGQIMRRDKWHIPSPRFLRFKPAQTHIKIIVSE